MTAHALRSQALVRRLLAAWTEAGLPVGGIEVAPDGTVRILAPAEATGLASARSRTGGNTCDEVFGE